MIVVYYGVNLSLCRSVSMSSLSLFFFPPSSSAYAPILISISSIVLRLISSSLFPSRLHTLPASPPLNLALCLASAGFFMPSAYAPIFIPLRCLPLSFCLLNCPYPAFFPSVFISILLRFPHPVRILFRPLNLAALHLLLPYLASSFPFLVLFRPHYLSILPYALLQPVSLCPLPMPRSSFPFAASRYLSAS